MEEKLEYQLVKEGKYKDTEYRIMLVDLPVTDNNGKLFMHTRWYTAYIKVPKRSIAQSLQVHGGVTFLETIGKKEDHPAKFTKGIWVGWDYAHFTDFTILFSPTGTNFREFGLHEWNKKEVFEEVKQAITSLGSMTDENDLADIQKMAK